MTLKKLFEKNEISILFINASIETFYDIIINLIIKTELKAWSFIDKLKFHSKVVETKLIVIYESKYKNMNEFKSLLINYLENVLNLRESKIMKRKLKFLSK